MFLLICPFLFVQCLSNVYYALASFFYILPYTTQFISFSFFHCFFEDKNIKICFVRIRILSKPTSSYYFKHMPAGLWQPIEYVVSNSEVNKQICGNLDKWKQKGTTAITIYDAYLIRCKTKEVHISVEKNGQPSDLQALKRRIYTQLSQSLAKAVQEFYYLRS